MKTAFYNIFIIAFYSLLLGWGSACSVTGPYEKTAKAAESVTDPGTDPDLASALRIIEKTPDLANGYNQLAVYYIKTARRTGDFALNTKAETAVTKALEVAPGDILARKLHASLQLTFHRFANGLELGNLLKSEFPKDAFVYGILTDANAELGNYEDAKASAQQMVDLRPDSSSYARVAHIRSLYGDHKGAVEMFIAAARTTDPGDKEGQSWCLVSLGKEYFKAGKFDLAENAVDEALNISPGYLLALVEKSRIMASRGDYAGATALIGDGTSPVLSPQAYKLRGEIASLQGNVAQANAEYQRAEDAARKLDGDMHPFALLWADNDMRLDEALDIAEKDFATNKDIYAADIYSWCLYKKGRYLEAKAAVDQAMRLKTNDPRILFHAGMIANALGDKKAAREYLGSAVRINPKFDLLQAEVATSALRSLNS